MKVKVKITKSNTFLLTSIFLISACGGGGGGGSAPAPLPTIDSFTASSLADTLVGSTLQLSWTSTNATSCTASGAWTGSKSSSGTESGVTVSINGTNTFTLTCSGTGGSSTPSSVSVKGFINITGVAVDGYISNSSIFIDENDSFTLDSTEVSTSGDVNGAFVLQYVNGTLVSLGGTDLDTQNPLTNFLLTNTLTGQTISVISPVTTLSSFLCINSTIACSGEGANINTLLGIDSSIDVNTTDPVASKGDGGINDFLYEKGNQITVLALSLQNIANNLNSTTDSSQDYFKAIAEELDLEFSTSSTKVDIENPTFITSVVENVITAKSLTVSADAKSRTISALTSVLPIIQVKSNAATTTAIIRFATGTLITDIVKLANGTQTDEIISSYNSGNIAAYIATKESIDASDLTPSVSSIADVASTLEDTALTIKPLSNDSYQTSLGASIQVSGQTNGSVVVDGTNSVLYTPTANFNGTETLQYTLTQASLTSSSTIAITVTAVNDDPVISTSSALTVDSGVTSVTTLSATDVDGDSVTISISGTDAASFSLSDTYVLAFKEAPDVAVKNSYSITASATDGTSTVTKDITISVVTPAVDGYKVLESLEVIETKE
jgi:hypothetical protein